MKLPLKGCTVLEFSQYLAGPYAGLRLADLGARVIKIERPEGGDACRQMATKNYRVDGDSVLFHTINRNKESFTADLKNQEELKTVKKLISQADIMTHNFRPGIMERIGLDYEQVKKINPGIIFGEVSGYGESGPWKDKPGQDLLAQSVSGLSWLTGNADGPPTPFGIAVADMICGTHLAQGLLAALVRKKRRGIGAKVSVSLLESILDFQFEGFTDFLNSNALPERSRVLNTHAYLGAPYGIYSTSDGHIAISMGCLEKLCRLIDCHGLESFSDLETQFKDRDWIRSVLQEHIKKHPTAYWLERLDEEDFWCSAVLDYRQLTSEEGYKILGMELLVKRDNGVSLTTTRCPIRYNGERLCSPLAAPELGNANDYLEKELCGA